MNIFYPFIAVILLVKLQRPAEQTEAKQHIRSGKLAAWGHIHTLPHLLFIASQFQLESFLMLKPKH